MYKIIKNTILAVLVVSILILTTGCYLIANTLVIYNTDGETKEIREDKFEEYEKKGWYDHPVTLVYNKDSEERVVATEDLDECKSDGWYTIDEKVVVYSVYGKAKQVSYKEYASYINDGWYDFPVNYKRDYATVLYNYLDSNPVYNDGAFNLIHIDDDGVPELVLRSNTCHAASVNVYTYKNGKVIEQHTVDESGTRYSGFGSWGDMAYNPKNGTFISQYAGMGHVMTSVFELSETGLVSPLVETHSAENDPLQPELYEVNGEVVSRGTYENALKPYEDMESAFGGEGYEFTRSTIKKVFGF